MNKLKQSELIEWAIRGLIAEKIQEPDEEKKMELDAKINELCVLLLLEIQKNN